MDDSFNLARHVARLFSLVARSPDAVDQQKLELRTIVLLTRDGTLRLTTRRGELMANGIAVPQVLAGVRDLSDQMTVHGIDAIDIGQDAPPGDVLAVARILAEPGEMDRQSILDRLAAASLTSVAVTLTGQEASGSHAQAPTAVPEPAVGSPERLPFILGRAARGGDGTPLSAHFDEVVFATEQAMREGRPGDAIGVFALLIGAEHTATDAEAQRQFVLAIRRLTKPHILYAVARGAIDGEAHRSAARAVLTRCGTDGADALVDAFARAATASERAGARETLDELPAIDQALVTMLSDSRVHMARVAAGLLGERKPRDGDQALADRLAKVGPMLRRALVRALGKYDSPFATDAVARGLADPMIEVRLEAASALARRKGTQASEIIGRALESESDVEVQSALIAALGRIATSDAVTRLAHIAEAATGLFAGRKDAVVRVAAARALAEARTPAALSALNALVNDKDREVRDVAARAIGR